jgi:hypothetical protein
MNNTPAEPIIQGSFAKMNLYRTEYKKILSVYVKLPMKAQKNKITDKPSVDLLKNYK